MEKKNITEINAVAAVIDGIFQGVEDHWGHIWLPTEKALRDAGVKLGKPEFIQFNFSLAAISLNFRSAFDLFYPEQAERFFLLLQGLFQNQFGEGQAYVAVCNSIAKYMDAYNHGVLKIRNPVIDVAMLLYYKIGLQNTAQKVVDETYFAPEPELVDLLTRALTMFLGKWEMLLDRYDIISPVTSALLENGENIAAE